VRYLVYGTGAVGGLVGGRLALSGQPVTFLARPRIAEAMQRGGLDLGAPGAPAHLSNPRVITELAEARGDELDAVLLAVKAYDCQEASAALAAIGGKAAVVCLLNGIGNEATLAAALGPGRVIAATLTTAVTMPEAGRIRVERERGLSLAVGHPLVPALVEDLEKAGFFLRLHANADRMKWSKVLTNIVTNASSAITGWLPGDVLADRGLCRLEIEALREVVRVMRAMGFAPEDLARVPIRGLALAFSLPLPLSQPILRRGISRGRGTKLPSFHYDIGRGRSEVAWLNGAVAREAAARGLAAPANAVLTEVMLGLVEGRFAREEFAERPEALLARARAAGVPGIRA
jgi:2-dehydropantoate 2-reductase